MTKKFIKYASVILDVAIDKMLDYGILPEQAPFIKRGMRVEVPLRRRLEKGYVYLLKDEPAFSPVQGIAHIISEDSLITEELFELAVWVGKYYNASLQQVLKLILPASIRGDTKPKQQLFVMRGKSKEDLRKYCEEIRNKHSEQANVLDVMLQVQKGILLSELLEKTQGSRSPVDTLAKKKYLLLDIVRVDRSPLVNEEYFKTKPKQLNEDQLTAFNKIVHALEKKQYETHLLYGITGSGKTEVYLQSIEKVLQSGKGTIVLVPEISLTTQMIERFRGRFEGTIAILHHRLSNGERMDEWNRIYRGDAKIVIGARSAIFSPVQDLGLIIVDEEHEQSYKQNETAPCYHARDVAVMRAKMTNSVVLLGSATPCLESYYNTQSGKYILSPLRSRADSSTLPQIKIIDMNKEYDRAKGVTIFSEALLDAIKRRFSMGEQTILFLNRRGYHTSLLCNQCRVPVKCQHCDVALTFHRGDNHLSCHLCNYTLSPPPSHCLICKTPNPMKYRGIGTELVQKALHAVLPDIRSLRLDADTTRHKGSHQKLLRDFGTGKADVLIGTQMIAKGLHFPEVTLVGVLNSDPALNIPDFRASEITFQLITQVSGRAGRGVISGEVVLQTCVPENSTIQLAAQQNFDTFYAEEISVRQCFHYPPFSSLIKLTCSGPDANQTHNTAEAVRGSLLAQLPTSFECHPVISSGHAKVKDKFRFQFLVKGPNVLTFNKAFASVIEKLKIPHQVRMLVDVNPVSTFF
jgi:primosomal protein N' (replication factor Y) (superfamily II helicase)